MRNLIRRSVWLTVEHRTLDLHSAANCIHNTWKLREQTVAGVLHDPAAVFGDLGVDQFLEVGLEPLVCAFLVRAHQPRVPCHISGQDRSEAAGLAHVSSPAAMCRPDTKSSRCSG